MKRRKVAVAMSGGVDSSLAAALLKEAGREVIGIHMKLWESGSKADETARRSDAAEDARRVCRLLDIRFEIVDFSTEFQERVIDYFCREYAQGRTPNPCVVCNKFIKFDLLLQEAISLGAECLATGHYARIEATGGKYRLLKAARPSVDQSYFLYTLRQQVLSRLLFPLGEYSKAEVRRMAAERGLAVAEKPKSQDICFIPDGRYQNFLKQCISSTPGVVMDQDGKVLGHHQGIAFYTVGQRTGLGIATGQRLFVLKIDPVSNALIVGREENLSSPGLRAKSLSFVGERPCCPADVRVKIRFRSPDVGARLSLTDDEAEVLFDQPQRAVTPGQAVVFYCGNEVLGGGIIEAS